MGALTPRRANVSALTTTTEITMTWHGRRVLRGQYLTVVLPPRTTGTRVAFVGLVTGPNGNSWVDVMTTSGHLRSVHLDAIRTVHNRRSTA